MVEKIIHSLEALENGRTLEQILGLFSEGADELRPVLETALLLANLPIEHSIQVQAKSRRQFLEKADSLREKSRSVERGFLGYWQQIFRPFAYLAAILIEFVAGIGFASQSALPGDVLYGAKLTVEGVRLSLVRDTEAQVQLQQTFENERLREILELIEQGREVEVFFEGVIESIDGDHWIVAGIPVEIGDITKIQVVPEVGLMVQITGRTDVDEMYANIVEARETSDSDR